MKKKLALSLVVACALVGVARCNTVYDVTITMSDAAAGRAFGCNLPNDAGPLLSRLFNKPSTIVIDVLDLGTEVVSCRGTEIYDYCGSNDCKLYKRECIPVMVTSAQSLGDALAQAFQQIKAVDAGISQIPTDRTVIVRMVATLEPLVGEGCPLATLDPTQVGGCAYSCPTKLAASGKLDLDLDSLFSTCAPIVEACATFPKVSVDP